MAAAGAGAAGASSRLRRSTRGATSSGLGGGGGARADAGFEAGAGAGGGAVEGCSSSAYTGLCMVGTEPTEGTPRVFNDLVDDRIGIDRFSKTSV
eukprot:1188578-Prorocentrum_minimum.AAC.3